MSRGRAALMTAAVVAGSAVAGKLAERWPEETILGVSALAIYGYFREWDKSEASQ